jgi:hypothetical protein
MRFRILVLLLISSYALAQNAPASTSSHSVATPVANSPVDNTFVHQQFGDTCSLETQWAPVTADLNGDGIEDIVMVARCSNPLIEQDDKNYKVIDPMDSFYGYGNTKVTTEIGQNDPRLHGICLLVIHGAGAEAWRSPSPQAKFVIINLAVKSVTAKKMRISKKKMGMAIYVEEATGDQMSAAIFWDGKKYRYEPLGSAME